jgi:ABC-type phosphate/phosphonate transport system ATPase subunit
VLRIEGCSLVYPNGVCALDGISLSFELGRFIVLLGASGAGKSSLLRCLKRAHPAVAWRRHRRR